MQARLMRGLHLRLFAARGRALPLASLSLEQPASASAPLLLLKLHGPRAVSAVATEVCGIDHVSPSISISG